MTLLGTRAPEPACHLPQLGLWGCLKGSKTDFLADKLAEFDQNDDGLLNFEEFKGFYNAAKDNAAGRKTKPKAVARTASSLDSGTQNARAFEKKGPTGAAGFAAKMAQKLKERRAAVAELTRLIQ